MNLRKLFTTLILGAAAFGAFACQYVYPNYILPQFRDSCPRLDHRRYFYLSGINTPGNHISGITRSDDLHEVSLGGDVKTWVGNQKVSYSASNHAVVSLPLTVYVGVADIAANRNYYGDIINQLYNYGREMEQITFTIQYRVMPESSWHTAAVKRFATGSVTALTKQRIFGGFEIDCAAPAGSTILVRLHVMVDILWAYYSNSFLTSQPYVLCLTHIGNADLDSPGVSNTSDIAATEVYQGVTHVSWIDADQVHSENRLSPDLHIGGDYDADIYPNNPKYLDGWTPQFMMAVRIANKRRPGK